MAKKPQAKDLAPAPEQRKPPAEEVNWINQPARICGNCEHFGISSIAKGIGDCHNLISGRWKPRQNEPGCVRGWYPSGDRFPLEKRYHGKA